MRSLVALACIGAALAIVSVGVRAEAAARIPKPRTTKPAPKRGPAPAPTPPLTSASLGLGDTKLSTLKAESNKAESNKVDSNKGEGKTDVYKPEPAAKSVEPAAVVRAAAPAVAPAMSRDRVIAPEPLAHRHFVVGFNPIPIVAGRYGVNVEVVPFVHHAFGATAFYQTFTPRVLEVLMPSRVDVSRGADAKIGGELGYRFYTGGNGAHGLFFGASGVAMPLALPRLTPDFRSEVVSFHAFGGAVDAGVQAITSFGLTIGGGIGAMYLAYDTPRSATPPPGAPSATITAPHVLPRLLLAAGWSF